MHSDVLLNIHSTSSSFAVSFFIFLFHQLLTAWVSWHLLCLFIAGFLQLCDSATERGGKKQTKKLVLSHFLLDDREYFFSSSLLYFLFLVLIWAEKLCKCLTSRFPELKMGLQGFSLFVCLCVWSSGGPERWGCAGICQLLDDSKYRPAHAIKK